MGHQGMAADLRLHNDAALQSVTIVKRERAVMWGRGRAVKDIYLVWPLMPKNVHIISLAFGRHVSYTDGLGDKIMLS
jgi:hypothetical protein